MLTVTYVETGMSKWALAMRLTGVGFYIGVCIAGGALLGWWLGGKNILFMILGLVVGLVAGGAAPVCKTKPIGGDNMNG